MTQGHPHLRQGCFPRLSDVISSGDIEKANRLFTLSLSQAFKHSFLVRLRAYRDVRSLRDINFRQIIIKILLTSLSLEN